jgi:hypothetical protein
MLHTISEFLKVQILSKKLALNTYKDMLNFGRYKKINL